MAKTFDLGEGLIGRVTRTMQGGYEWVVISTDGVMVYSGTADGPESAAAAARARVAKGDKGDGDTPAAAAEATDTPDDDSAGEPADSGKKLRGKLPDGFPGKAALEEAGHGTYAKVRKLHDQGKLVEVPGIGEATAGHIGEALAES